jgi:hypothetical protein
MSVLRMMHLEGPDQNNCGYFELYREQRSLALSISQNCAAMLTAPDFNKSVRGFSWLVW